MMLQVISATAMLLWASFSIQVNAATFSSDSEVLTATEIYVASAPGETIDPLVLSWLIESVAAGEFGLSVEGAWNAYHDGTLTLSHIKGQTYALRYGGGFITVIWDDTYG